MGTFLLTEGWDHYIKMARIAITLMTLLVVSTLTVNARQFKGKGEVSALPDFFNIITDLLCLGLNAASDALECTNDPNFLYQLICEMVVETSGLLSCSS